MNHYTYEIKFENDMKYLGVRSCKCAISDDIYTGSSKLIPPELYGTCQKTILGIFDTRIEAQEDEILRHAKLDVARNPEYYNGINAKSTGFSPIGLTKERSERVKLRAEKFRAYRGENERLKILINSGQVVPMPIVSSQLSPVRTVEAFENAPVNYKLLIVNY